MQHFVLLAQVEADAKAAPAIVDIPGENQPAGVRNLPGLALRVAQRRRIEEKCPPGAYRPAHERHSTAQQHEQGYGASENLQVNHFVLFPRSGRTSSSMGFGVVSRLNNNHRPIITSPIIATSGTNGNRMSATIRN